MWRYRVPEQKKETFVLVEYSLCLVVQSPPEQGNICTKWTLPPPKKKRPKALSAPTFVSVRGVTVWWHSPRRARPGVVHHHALWQAQGQVR